MKKIIFSGLMIILFIANLYSQKEQKIDYKGELIYIFSSKACGCTMKKCTLMDKELSSIMKDDKYKEIKFTKIDYSEYKDKAEKIYNKFELDGLPVCVLLDKDKNVKYNASFIINKKLCIKALNEIINKEE